MSLMLTAWSTGRRSTDLERPISPHSAHDRSCNRASRDLSRATSTNSGTHTSHTRTRKPRWARSSRLVLGEVDEPVLVRFSLATGVDERVSVRAVLLAAQNCDDLFSLAPLFEFVGAGIPDVDVATAVFTLRDVALEAAVLERVVLCLYREMILPIVGRDTFRQCPTHEYTIVLEAEIPVQSRGVVL